jgi:hypothetical protein
VNQPGFLAITALLALGAFGWGKAFCHFIDQLGAPDRRVSVSGAVTPPLMLTIGVAVVLFVGGVAVAGDIATFPFLVSFLAIGAAVTVGSAVARIRAGGIRVPDIRTMLVAASFTIVAFLAYGAALSGPLNANDDDPGYVYLAKRLLATGGLIDPFNLRRITSYGGGEIFQALVIRSTGSDAALGAEWFFFVLLVTALAVGRTSRQYAAPVALVIGLGLTVVHPVGIWANSAPTFSGLALTLGVLQLLAVSAGGERNWRVDVCIGVLIGGLLALRFQFVVPAVAAVLAIALYRSGRRAWRPIVVIGATTIATTIGWAVALDRSSGTLLFPLFPGTYNVHFPWADPAITTTRHFLVRLWGEIGTAGLGVEIVAVLCACVVLVGFGRATKTTGETATIAVIVVGCVVGCLVLVVSETQALSGGVLADLGRYNAPSALAVTLLVLGELWKLGGRRRDGASVNREASDSERWSTRLRGTACATMASTLFVIPVGAAIPMNVPPGAALRGLGKATYNEGAHAVKRITGASGSASRFTGVKLKYDAINKVVPRGSHILAAVSEPGLLDFFRFTFATLDIAGAASPRHGIPLTSGARAVVAYLKGLGYNGIVASVTSAPGLYNYKAWSAATSSGIENYRAMGTQFTAWAHDLSQLNHEPAVHRVRIGTLEYLSWSTPTRLN